MLNYLCWLFCCLTASKIFLCLLFFSYFTIFHIQSSFKCIITSQYYNVTREFFEALIWDQPHYESRRALHGTLYFSDMFPLSITLYSESHTVGKKTKNLVVRFYSGLGFELKGKYKSHISNGFLPSKDEKCNDSWSKFFYSMLTTAAVKACLYSYGCIQRWC